MTGEVKFFGTSYGFIVTDDPDMADVFVHHSQIEPWRKGFKTLTKGQAVKFDLEEIQKDNGINFQARNVEISQKEITNDARANY